MNTTDQYNVIRSSIRDNLATIRSLLTQADSLHDIVGQLDDKVDNEEKKKLNDSINNIYKSIDLLVIQTDTLFKTFIKYADSTEELINR
jgi:Mg2+/Co2+ transporter CorC